MRTLSRIPVLAALLLAGAAAPVRSQSSDTYAKIILMDKMTRFVEWPRPVDTDRPFLLAVIGRTPFGEVLDDYFSQHPLKSRPVTVRYLRQVQELEDADLVFICESEKPRLPQILARLKGRQTLTVAESDGFVRAGVMVGFISEGGKISFEINPNPIRESGLRMRPDFLQLARIVP
jgi:hypothetical protein